MAELMGYHRHDGQTLILITIHQVLEESLPETNSAPSSPDLRSVGRISVRSIRIIDETEPGSFGEKLRESYESTAERSIKRMITRRCNQPLSGLEESDATAAQRFQVCGVDQTSPHGGETNRVNLGCSQQSRRPTEQRCQGLPSAHVRAHIPSPRSVRSWPRGHGNAPNGARQSQATTRYADRQLGGHLAPPIRCLADQCTL